MSDNPSSPVRSSVHEEDLKALRQKHKKNSTTTTTANSNTSTSSKSNDKQLTSEKTNSPVRDNIKENDSNNSTIQQHPELQKLKMSPIKTASSAHSSSLSSRRFQSKTRLSPTHAEGSEEAGPPMPKPLPMSSGYIEPIPEDHVPIYARDNPTQTMFPAKNQQNSSKNQRYPSAEDTTTDNGDDEEEEEGDSLLARKISLLMETNKKNHSSTHTTHASQSSQPSAIPAKTAYNTTNTSTSQPQKLPYNTSTLTREDEEEEEEESISLPTSARNTNNNTNNSTNTTRPITSRRPFTSADNDRYERYADNSNDTYDDDVYDTKHSNKIASTVPNNNNSAIINKQKVDMVEAINSAISTSPPLQSNPPFTSNLQSNPPQSNPSGIAEMAIRVVVRKRPISQSETSRGDYDVLDVDDGGQVYIHEPKIKVCVTFVCIYIV